MGKKYLSRNRYNVEFIEILVLYSNDTENSRQIPMSHSSFSRLSNHAVRPMWFYETSGFLDLLLFVAIFSGVFVCFYCRQLNDQLARGPEFDKKTVLVVTAHPDDECMFFAPTILNLKRFSTIHLLCLSTGIHGIKRNQTNT